MLRFVLVLLLVCGCGTDAPPGERGPARAPSSDAPCAEHGVLQAVCPKCNPKLAPVFQAKGDWCGEHGLPESLCPVCHPERGGRPAVALVEADGPADGTLVQLDSAGTARVAGIETVEARSVETSTEIVVLGTIAHDATRRAEVNARFGGIVRELALELGARVEEGAVLARIDSAEVGTARSRLLAAKIRAETAQASFERLTALSAQQLASKRSLDEARFELEAARAEVTALLTALEPVGTDASLGGRYDVRAPLAGVVVRREGTVGQMVATETLLYEIVDPSWVWAELDIPEAELARVRAGLDAVVSSDSLPGREFRGRIDHIAPEIDVHTRTAKARVRIANPDGQLRANQFVRGRIVVERLGARVLVPRDAVQRAGEVLLVFVELEPARYQARRVRTGAFVGDEVECLRGVTPGERVVTRGSFLLKTETLKGEIGAGCCAVE